MESLYRKYRPQTFADVVGQQHVVGTLQRAVMEGRTSHAYLFCGPRGTGKTTMARLLAKSLMCEQGPGQLPDGTCEQCELIAAGEHPDVYELDAASRTGVDNVREEIINRVGYAPVRGRCKVYIIDEVHMLTTAAFNALLKTLEEPPDHVVFVLCTTDPQKIPATILSRVQRFDFRPIGNDDIRARLAYVCEREGFAYEDAALDLVVRHARGGMRDALSTLEQLSVFGAGTISADATQDLLGAVPGAEMGHVVEALAARDVPMLFLQVGELIESGRDPLQFVRDLAAHMRDVYVVAVVGPRPEVLDSSVDVERLRSEAEAFGSADRIARVLTILGEVTYEMATAPNQRLVLEIAFTRMARPREDLTLESLAERLADLERRMQGLASSGLVVSGTTAPGLHGQAQLGGPQQAPIAQAQQAPQPRVATQATELQRPAQSQPTIRSRVAQPHPAAQSQPAVQPQAAQQQYGQQSGNRFHNAGPASQNAQTTRPQQVSPQSAPVTDAGELQRRWRSVVSEITARVPARGSLLANATAMSDDGTKLVVSLPKGSSFSLKMLERPDVRALVEGVVAEQFGKRTMVYREGIGSQQQYPQQSAQQAPQTQSFAQQPAPSYSTPQQYAQQPTRQQPAPQQYAQQPQPPTSQAPASAQQPDPGYPMPWDDPAGSSSVEDQGTDYVPYEELGMTGYVEEEPASAVVPDGGQDAATPFGPNASQTTEAPQPQTAPSSTRGTTSTAPTRAQEPMPVAAESPAQEPDSQPEIPDDLPPELATVLANAFEVFGMDVKVSRGSSRRS